MGGSRVATAVLALASLLAAGGCEPGRFYARSPADNELFGAQAVRIHPTFTRSKDWNGDGKPDGIEAVLELQDQFGEPTRATGRAMFEAYQYRPYSPDPRGRRYQAVWEWALVTRQQQIEHWSRALRGYTFRIPLDPGRQTIVLAATFQLNGGTPRLFDQIILEPSGRTGEVGAAAPGATTAPEEETPRRPRRQQPPTTQPVTQPASAPAEVDPDFDIDPLGEGGEVPDADAVKPSAKPTESR
jgi:hypothetical protein